MPRRELMVERIDEDGLSRWLLTDVTIPDKHEVKVLEEDDHVHVRIQPEPEKKKSAPRKSPAKKSTAKKVAEAVKGK